MIFAALKLDTCIQISPQVRSLQRYLLVRQRRDTVNFISIPDAEKGACFLSSPLGFWTGEWQFHSSSVCSFTCLHGISLLIWLTVLNEKLCCLSELMQHNPWNTALTGHVIHTNALYIIGHPCSTTFKQVGTLQVWRGLDRHLLMRHEISDILS